MDRELRFMLLITRNLPQFRGMIRIGRFFRDFYLRKKRNDITIDVLGFKMRLMPGESFSNSACLFFPRLYDYREIKFLKRNLKSGDIFLDIGAHIGFYSLIASQLVGGKGKVLAVEADPYIYQKFLYNIQLNSLDNIIALNYGVSDKEEELELGINTDSRGKSSFLKESDTKTKVHCASLCEILRQAGMEGKKIKGLKIDVEGFEYKALKPFLEEGCTKKNLPEFIITEYNREIYQDRLMNLLLSSGYELYQKYGSNHIFVRKI